MNRTAWVCLLAAGCIDLDREPEWETGQWRDTWNRGLDTGDVDWARDTADAPPDRRRCVVGTGETAWQSLFDGDELTVHWGPQGGWHVFGSVWCQDLLEPGGPVADFWDPTNPIVTFQLLDDTRGVFGGYEGLRRGMDNGDPPQLIGELIIFRTSTCEENLYREATLRAIVWDADGASFSDEVRVTLVPEPGREPPVDTSPPDTDPPGDSDP